MGGGLPGVMWHRLRPSATPADWPQRRTAHPAGIDKGLRIVGLCINESALAKANRPQGTPGAHADNW